MSKTLAQINQSDTFQIWLQRTNDIITELGASVMTTSVEGDTTLGSASITGNFSANTMSVQSTFRTNIIDTKVGNTSPIDIRGTTEFTASGSTPVTITNSTGPKVRIRNSNIAWAAGLRGSTGTGTGSEYIISLESAVNPTYRFSANGTFYANSISLTSAGSSSTSAVRADRSISTTDGITGGGNLTANRTIGLTGNALNLINLSNTGIIIRMGANALETRAIVSGDGIVVLNGRGTTGDPTIEVDGTVVRTTGNQSISGLKTLSSDVMVGSSSSNQLYIYNAGIIASPNADFTDSFAINYETKNNAHYRDFRVFDGKSTVIAKFEGESSSLIIGNTLANQVQLVGSSVNGSPNYVGVAGLAINYSNNTDSFRNLAVYDGKSNKIAVFTGSSGNFATYGDITAYGDIRTSSDARLKTNVSTVDNALNKVLAMRGVYFDRNGIKNVGVIAQEMEVILPEVVSNEEEYKTVAYGNIVGVLIEAIKQLKNEIEELKNK